MSILSSQYRLIEKRLVSKLRAKTPMLLTNLGILLDDTFSEITTTIEKLMVANTELKKSQIELECCLNAILCLLRLMDMDKKLLSLVESVFQPFVYDVENQVKVLNQVCTKIHKGCIKWCSFSRTNKTHNSN